MIYNIVETNFLYSIEKSIILRNWWITYNDILTTYSITLSIITNSFLSIKKEFETVSYYFSTIDLFIFIDSHGFIYFEIREV